MIVIYTNKLLQKIGVHTLKQPNYYKFFLFFTKTSNCFSFQFCWLLYHFEGRKGVNFFFLSFFFRFIKGVSTVYIHCTTDLYRTP